MAVYPIIFSGPMIRALLNGYKTETRRTIPTPLGKVRRHDLLWVRETAALCQEGWTYRADMKSPLDVVSCPCIGVRWRPAIHMPRVASRISLRVISVAVQQLHDITFNPAREEGIEWLAGQYGVPGLPQTFDLHPRESYAKLWNHINGAGAWEANPQVGVIRFEVIKENIDRVAT